jgi:hypothetical protein
MVSLSRRTCSVHVKLLNHELPVLRWLSLAERWAVTRSLPIRKGRIFAPAVGADTPIEEAHPNVCRGFD